MSTKGSSTSSSPSADCSAPTSWSPSACPTDRERGPDWYNDLRVRKSTVTEKSHVRGRVERTPRADARGSRQLQGAGAAGVRGLVVRALPGSGAAVGGALEG